MTQYNIGTVSFDALGNPFRYRGYYYDRETGFYYLQSRYYDPATGRFINADDLTINDGINAWLKGGVKKGMHPSEKKQIRHVINAAKNSILNGFKDDFVSAWAYGLINEGTSWMFRKVWGVS